jgi:hypothetical protein
MKKTFSGFLVLLTIVFGIDSCKKETTTPPPASLHPQVRSNVIVVDSSKWLLRSNVPELNQGIFRFAFNQSSSYIQVNVGDIIIGSVGEGYIRKISSIDVNGYDMVLHTRQASLSDVFTSGNYNFSMNMDGMVPNAVTPGFSYSFNNTSIYRSGTTQVKLLSGQLSMDPKWSFNFSFDSFSMKTFGMTADNFSFSENFGFNVVAPQPLDLQNYDFPLGSFSKKHIQWIPVGDINVPVVVTMKVDLNVKTYAVMNYTKDSRGNLATNDVLSLGVRYDNGHWDDNFSSTASKTIQIDSISGSQSVNISMSLKPQITVKICGVDYATINTGLNEALQKKVNTNTGDWGLSAHNWFTLNTDVISTTILDKTIPRFSKDRVSDSTTYTSPKTIGKISGDAQTGAAGLSLANPVVVKVLDSKGNPQRGVTVHFVPAGAGSVTPANINTDQNGFAQTTWKLGPTLGTQTLYAKVLNGSSQLINGGAPATFTATAQ